MISSKITGTGAFIPSVIKKNKDFLNKEFLNEDGTTFSSDTDEIIEKFKAITGIEERRYAKPEFNASDLAFHAAENAIKDANINKAPILRDCPVLGIPLSALGAAVF